MNVAEIHIPKLMSQELKSLGGVVFHLKTFFEKKCHAYIVKHYIPKPTKAILFSVLKTASYCSQLMSVVFNECTQHMSFLSARHKEDMADYHNEAQCGRRELHLDWLLHLLPFQGPYPHTQMWIDGGCGVLP